MFSNYSRMSSQFVVLPPPGAKVPRIFQRIEVDNRRHNILLARMQRLRGRVYLDDGAIRDQDLTPDARHRLPDDDFAWHVLSVGEGGQVTACLRYLDERNSGSFRGLWVSHSALASCPRQGWKLRMAVQSKMEWARATRLGFGSVGGWAAAPNHRRTLEPVSIILATYGLLELLGGCLGVATATFRHHSATILRKIGLNPLTWGGDEIAPYFDPKYGCQMEMLEFDSRFPNPKYRAAVEEFSAALSRSAVVACEEPQMSSESACFSEADENAWQRYCKERRNAELHGLTSQ